jgi:hypothetical protein
MLPDGATLANLARERSPILILINVLLAAFSHRLKVPKQEIGLLSAEF